MLLYLKECVVMKNLFVNVIIKCIFILAFFFLFPRGSLAESYDVTAYIDLEVAADQPIREYLKNPGEDSDDTPPINIQRSNIASWLDHLLERGITVVTAEVMNLDGAVFYPSTVLGKIGFKQPEDYGDLFSFLVEESKNRNLKVNVLIEDLAHIIQNGKEYSDQLDVSVISPEIVSSWIGELAEIGRQHGTSIWVNEEAYSTDYIAAIERRAKIEGITYVHFFDDRYGRGDIWLSEDYATYPMDPSRNKADANMLVNMSKMGSVHGTLGHLNIMYAHAVSQNKPAGCLTAGEWGMQNKVQPSICLFRSVQFDLAMHGFVAATQDDGSYNPNELRFAIDYDHKILREQINRYGKKSSDAPKPVANLIITHAGENDEYYFDMRQSVLQSASTALLAAGYELRVTHDQFLENAVLYYVVGVASLFDQKEDLPDTILSLSDNPEANSVKVIYHPLGIPNSKNWLKTMARAGGNFIEGLSGNEDISPIPYEVEVIYQNKLYPVHWRGHYPWPENSSDAARQYEEHMISVIDSDMPLIVGNLDAQFGLDNTKIPLVISKNKIFFINGNYLHLDAASALANLFSGKPVYLSPSYGYLTTGKDRSAFFAAAETEVKLRIGNTCIAYAVDASGQSIRDAFKVIDGVMHGNSPKWGLIIATANEC
ncbi:MAG: hypothetical protein HON65_16130 [Rhodospirillales bacterium]|jgi:hypothetical protein|nr:hypothetical protein [Rhodospirillales bacterium]